MKPKLIYSTKRPFLQKDMEGSLGKVEPSQVPLFFYGTPDGTVYKIWTVPNLKPHKRNMKAFAVEIRSVTGFVWDWEKKQLSEKSTKKVVPRDYFEEHEPKGRILQRIPFGMIHPGDSFPAYIESLYNRTHRAD